MKERVEFFLYHDTLRRIEHAADLLGMSRSDFLTVAIERILEEDDITEEAENIDPFFVVAPTSVIHNVVPFGEA